MIIINARFLTQPITGVQRYGIEICKELKKLKADLVFVTPNDVIHDQLFRELKAKKIGFFKGHLWEQIDLKIFVNKHKALLLSLGNTAPLFLKKQVVTIHDLSVFQNPEWHSFLFRSWYRFMIPKIAKKSVHIITVSNSSKKELIEILKIPKDKITVAYNGISEIFIQSDDTPVPTNNLDFNYILTVSSHHPRKNFKKLIAAFNALHISGLNLVIVGNFNKHFKSKDWEYDKNENIVFMKGVDDNNLLTLYQNAEFFIYPSLYEGFGIPIIEAAAQGVKLCVSSIPVFKEICESNAIYFDPKDPTDITDKIQKCIKSNNYPSKNHFIEKFSWRKSSIEIMNSLKSYV